MTTTSAAPVVRPIPFGRPMLGREEREAVMEVLSQPVLTHGPLVKEFEARLIGHSAKLTKWRSRSRFAIRWILS